MKYVFLFLLFLFLLVGNEDAAQAPVGLESTNGVNDRNDSEIKYDLPADQNLLALDPNTQPTGADLVRVVEAKQTGFRR